MMETYFILLFSLICWWPHRNTRVHIRFDFISFFAEPQMKRGELIAAAVVLWTLGRLI